MEASATTQTQALFGKFAEFKNLVLFILEKDVSCAGVTVY
jgi:hypothetical protein